MGAKVKVRNPIVEIDGDEMARVMWAMVKARLLTPHVEMETLYYDLGLAHRDATDDQVTVEAAHATREHGVAVKCATIIPTAERAREYGLKHEWQSPTATLRGLLDGTVFRAPIIVGNIQPAVRSWKRPIHLARHAYGDVYKNHEIAVPGPGRAHLSFSPSGEGKVVSCMVQVFEGPGVLQGIHNTDASIESFARACFTYASEQKLDVWFGAKDTVSKTYDARFRDIFAREYEAHWQARFEAEGRAYVYAQIDETVARIMRSEGGMLWACKGYDGDVMAALLASAYGSRAMQTSLLLSPQGGCVYEAAHGTVQRHYYSHLAGEESATNPMALLFAWSGALRKRGTLDDTPEVVTFAAQLEAAGRATVESGIMTADLLTVADPNPDNRSVGTEAFLDAVAEQLERLLTGDA